MTHWDSLVAQWQSRRGEQLITSLTNYLNTAGADHLQQLVKTTKDYAEALIQSISQDSTNHMFKRMNIEWIDDFFDGTRLPFSNNLSCLVILEDCKEITPHLKHSFEELVKRHVTLVESKYRYKTRVKHIDSGLELDFTASTSPASLNVTPCVSSHGIHWVSHLGEQRESFSCLERDAVLKAGPRFQESFKILKILCMLAATDRNHTMEMPYLLKQSLFFYDDELKKQKVSWASQSQLFHCHEVLNDFSRRLQGSSFCCFFDQGKKIQPIEPWEMKRRLELIMEKLK